MRCVACAGLVLAMAATAFGQQGKTRGEQLAESHIREIEKYVPLSAAQKQSITEIMQEREKELEACIAKNSEKWTAAKKRLEQAHHTGDQEAIKKALEEQLLAQAPLREIVSRFSKRLDEVITREQRAEMEEMRLEATIKVMAHPAALTVAQIKAVKAAREGNTPAEEYESLKQAVGDILTPQQRAAVAGYQALMMVKAKMRSYKVDLTDEQQKELSAACESLAKDGSLEAGELTKKLEEKWYQLLNAEQRAAVDKVRKRGTN